ncbi:MAG: hypothetical protein AB7C92_07890 [Synergistaceae bacterium]
MSAVKFNAQFSGTTNFREESETASIETAVAKSTEGVQTETKLQYDAANNALRVGGNPRLEEQKLFIENYELIWENRVRIINDEALSETRLYFSGLSLAYVSGGGLTLGMLLKLWNNGEWTTKCPFCGGTVRIFSWGGSPLTGSNKYHGFCTSCKRERADSGDNFIQNVRSALRMISDRKARYAKAHPDRASNNVPPKVVNYDFRTLSKKWTEYEKDPEKIPATKPKKATSEKPEDQIWYSPIRMLIYQLNNSTL